MSDDRDLIAFHRHGKADYDGRTLDDYLTADDTWWEKCHQHIQWAFPLPEKSRMQLNTPIASVHFFCWVRTDPVMQANQLILVGRFLHFLENTSRWWREAEDHNHLRITRCLRCLTLCGMHETAQMVLAYCLAHAQAKESGITAKTFWYWTEAIAAEPAWLYKKDT